jgi:hypothetical protein
VVPLPSICLPIVYLDVFEEYLTQVDDQELKFGYLHEDGVMCYKLNWSLGEINAFFADKIISNGLW